MRHVCVALVCGFLLAVPGLIVADEGMTIGSALDPLAQPSDYEVGFDLMKAGKFLQAIEAFEKAIAADPAHANGVHQYGILLPANGPVRARHRVVSQGARYAA